MLLVNDDCYALLDDRFWWFWQWLVDLQATHGCRIIAPMSFCRIGGGVR